MKTFLRLLQLVAPFKGWMALSVLLGFATVGSGIGLFATAAFLIACAALHPSVADLAVPIVGVRLFGLSRGVFRYLERYVSHNATLHLLARLRVWFYQGIEPQAPARLLLHRSGDLLARSVSDVETLQHFFIRVVAPPVVALLVVVAVGLFLATFDGGLAWVLVAILLVAGLVVPLLVERLGRKPSIEMTAIRAELNVQLIDGIQGMADLAAFGRVQDQLERVMDLNRRLANRQDVAARITGLHGALGTLLSNLGMWAVLALSIPLVAVGKIDGVFLPVLALAALASFEAVSPLPAAFQQLGGSLESARRLFEIVEVGGRGDVTVREGNGETGKEEDAESQKPPLPMDEMVGGGVRPSPSTTAMIRTSPSPTAVICTSPSPSAVGEGRGEGNSIQRSIIAVKDLRFRYGPDEPWVLDGVSFELRQGQRMAIVGPSGAGKSTLLHLLLRFWDHYEGQIVLHGRELRTIEEEDVRRQFAVVSQRTYLFSGTIRQNLLLAKPEATEDELVQAAELAQLHRFVKGLPDGYDSWIGEQGMQLSGGERQRLAIARAILKGSPLLLLDEPSANLDDGTERELMRALDLLMESRTTLIATHRLETLREVDLILALERDERL